MSSSDITPLKPTIMSMIYNKYLTGTLNNTIKCIEPGIIGGSILLSLLTLNSSIFVLIFFFIEIYIVRGQLVNMLSYLFPSVVNASTALYSPLFVFTATLSYLNTSLLAFSDVLSRIGGEYTPKIVLSVVTSIIMITLLVTYFIYNGISAKSSLFTVFVAIIMGAFFLFINNKIFTKNEINFLGLPLLNSITGSSAPIYACGIKA
jgi:hypothetical protein